MKPVWLFAFACGVLFSLGLGVSGMTQPHKVIAFLDLKDWDPSLLLVMVGAISVYAPVYWISCRRHCPWLDSRFHVPAPGRIDRKLIFGAVLFGIGWGLAGYCPGPALVSLASGQSQSILFVSSMAAGVALYKLRPLRKMRQAPLSQERPTVSIS